MNRFCTCLGSIAAVAAIASWSAVAARSQLGDPSHEGSPLVVGWNDEFNGSNWRPRLRPHMPHISTRRKGFLGLGSDVRSIPIFPSIGPRSRG
jgi:hypothetical protein